MSPFRIRIQKKKNSSEMRSGSGSLVVLLLLLAFSTFSFSPQAQGVLATRGLFSAFSPEAAPAAPGGVEDELIKSLGNCPLCAGHEPCLIDCKKVQQRPWKECLGACLKDNPLLIDMMGSMAQKMEERQVSDVHLPRNLGSGSQI